jgi:hypothetical protein
MVSIRGLFTKEAGGEGWVVWVERGGGRWERGRWCYGNFSDVGGKLLGVNQACTVGPSVSVMVNSKPWLP